jgi:hypothetical protein
MVPFPLRIYFKFILETITLNSGNFLISIAPRLWRHKHCGGKVKNIGTEDSASRRGTIPLT